MGGIVVVDIVVAVVAFGFVYPQAAAAAAAGSRGLGSAAKKTCDMSSRPTLLAAAD